MLRWAVAVVAACSAVPGWAATLDSITTGHESGTTVTMHLSAPTVPWARSLPGTTDSPARIYVDLVDTTLAPGIEREASVDAAPVMRIRTGQFSPTTVRVVLELTDALPFELQTNGATVTVALRGAAEPAQAEALPSAPPVVVIDAGHGGQDPGAAGVGGVLEKHVVLEIAHRLAAKVPARLPVDSLLTRSDDTFVPLKRRLPSDARALFVSLHANACDDARPQGLEIYHGRDRAPRGRPGSASLAHAITDALRARFVPVRGRPRRGSFTVLAANPAPSVLVELGYLTNTHESARLLDPHYQELITDALVDGIAAYLQAAETSVASLPGPR